MDLKRFLKGNKIKRENAEYAASTRFVDENGEPMKWIIRPIHTKENEHLKEQCITEVPVPGKFGMYRPKLDLAQYGEKLLSMAVVAPDLEDAELQDSYGVSKPGDLLKEMLDEPGEYDALLKFVQKMNGFDKSAEEKIEEAKN